MVVIQLGIPKTKSDNSCRRNAKLNFRIKSGVLYYYASSVSAEERRRWGRVITAKEERHRVITSASCHASAEGKHRGDICWSSYYRMAAILEKNRLNCTLICSENEVCFPTSIHTTNYSI